MTHGARLPASPALRVDFPVSESKHRYDNGAEDSRETAPNATAVLPLQFDELLELIRLPDMGDRYPSEVSGGQQQRIAVARAVAFPPRVLLMDEPLGALDLKLRETMQIEVRRIQRELSITTVYVTHDQTEAMNMSDRIAVMNDGVIEQLGTAEEIYGRPASRFVAGFVGQINLVSGRVVGEEGEWVVVEAAGFGHGHRSRIRHAPARRSRSESARSCSRRWRPTPCRRG